VELPADGFHGIAGRSGIGKSTFARVLAQELQPDSVETLLTPSKTLYCAGDERLPRWQRVKNHLESVCPSGRQDVLADLRRAFDIDSMWDRDVQALSTGELARVNVLRYVLQDCDLLILDECLSTVDQGRRRRVLAALKMLATSRGQSILYISHQIADTVAFSCSIIHMHSDGNGPALLRVLPGYDAETFPENTAEVLRSATYEVLAGGQVVS